MRYIIIAALFLLVIGCSKDPALTGESGYETFFGGQEDEYAHAMVALDDGSVVIAGETNSYGSGNFDVLLVKFNKNGEQLWYKTFGGSDEERGYALLRSNEGNFIIAGITRSIGAGQADAYMLSADSEGNLLWERTYGGAGNDEAWSMTAVPGGYMLAGFTDSYGNGGQDIFLVSTDASGNQLSYKTYGGAQDDIGMSIASAGNTLLVLGNTNSFGQGNNDMYLLRTGLDGDTLNTFTLGTSEYEEAHHISQTTDGNIFVAGHTAGLGDIDHDMYAAKIGVAGSLIWQYSYGKSGMHDGANAGMCTSDGGYILAGRGAGQGGSDDLSIIKLNASGIREWEKRYGGIYADEAMCITESRTSYYAAGYTSHMSGTRDLFLVKIPR